MNPFESLKYDETSVKSLACPRSPESNISDVKQAFSEETNPKLVYERDPPDGSEIRHDTAYQFGPENQLHALTKVMKDKDLSSSTREDKMDNIGDNISYDRLSTFSFFELSLTRSIRLFVLLWFGFERPCGMISMLLGCLLHCIV